MNIIFFGNTKYSLIGAKILHSKLGLTAIVTIKESPVAKFATQQNIPLIITKKINDETIQQLKSFDADFFVVEDYGLILPNKLLEIPKIAALNIHHSLLPKFRGPTPAPSAILAGEKISGVSIIKMSDKVDAGDIYGQEKYELKPDETTDSLLTVLNQLGGNLMIYVLQNFQQITPISQPTEDNNYTPRLARQDGFFDLKELDSADPLKIKNLKLKIERATRAYFPWPGVWTKMKLNKDGKEKIVKFLPNIERHSHRSFRHSELDSESSAVSGSQIKSGMTNDFLLQVEGKKPMSIKDFINGYPDKKELILRLFS